MRLFTFYGPLGMNRYALPSVISSLLMSCHLTSRYQYFISDVSFTSKLAFQYFDDNCIIHASRIWSSLIHWNLLIIIVILNIMTTANQQISNLIFLVEQDKFRGRFFVGQQFFLVNYQVLCNKMNNSWLLLMILIQFTDARTCKFVHLCMHWNWNCELIDFY